jgi:hypothetical protein
VTRGGQPCVAGHSTRETCVVGLLLGAACCSDGVCACCRAVVERMRRSGFRADAIARSVARSRAGLLDCCPSCGFPPPRPLEQFPPLARLDRSDRKRAPATECVQCGRQLVTARKRYCSPECWNAYVSWTRKQRRLARV